MNNPQRVFDILPPQKKQSELRVQKAEAKEDKQKKQEPPKIHQTEKKQFPLWKKFFVLLIIFAALFVSLSQFVFNRSEIQISPKTDNFVLSDKLGVSTSKASVNVAAAVIPGKIIEEEKTVSQDFTSSGKTQEGGKATGRIRVYNNYSTSPQVLIATTRFISSEGKLFRAAEKVTVPGATSEKGKLQPGYADVNVIADQAGEDYNIAPTTFSIPGFLGTAKYTAFYGKSLEAMAGGFLGQGSQVTKEDLDKAGKTLVDMAKVEGKKFLKEKTSAELLYSEDAVSFEVMESSSTLQAGAKGETFNYHVKMKLKTVAFKKSDLDDFSKNLILSEYATQKSIKEGSLKDDWKVDSYDISAGKLTLGVSLSAVVYPYINQEELIAALAGKNLSEAQELVLSLPEITNVRITSWPFWANSLPQDENKIKIKVILD
jgi:hypothetical protein